MLSKNILRTIKQKPFQFLSIVTLVMMASFIYVTLQGAISSVSYFLTDYTEGTNQEDFFVVLSAPSTQDIRKMIAKQGVSVTALAEQSKSEMMKDYEYTLVDYYDDRVAELGETFNATLEGRFYRDVVTEVNDITYSYRVIKQTDSVNMTYVLDGYLPRENDEVAVFKTYADANNLRVGDSILIKDQYYNISAFIAVPDYIYPIFNYDNPLYEQNRETIVIMTDDSYSLLTEKQWVLYSGYFNDEDVDTDKEVSKISNTDGVAYAMSKDINVRISTVNAHLSSNELLSVTFTGLLLLMSVIVILLIMKKRINADRLQIGILKSMGYSSIEIAISYLSYPVLAGLIGSLIGFFTGIGAASLMANTYMTNYIVPLIRFYFTKDLILGGVVYPLLIIAVFSFIILFVLLRDEPLQLMKESSHLKVSKLSQLLMKLLKPFKFETRFKYSLAFRNMGKIFSLFTIVLIASIFLVFASLAFKTVENVVDKAFEYVQYSYQIKYNKLINEPLKVTESAFLEYAVTPLLEEKTTSFCLYGIESSNFVNPLYNAKGENITSLARKGVIINEFIARAYSLDVGDTLQLEVKNKVLTYPIVGVVDHYNGPMLYTELSQLLNDLEFEAGYYNGKWSSDHQLTDKNISYVFSIDDLARNIEVGMEMIRVSLMIMVAVAAILGSLMMILITTFIIEENQKQISILKVMGYSEKEISKMVLTIYFPFVIVAYLISIPLTRAGVDYIMTLIASELPMAIPTDFTIIQAIIGGATVIITYIIAMKCSKVQLDKISLQEVLKY